MQFENKDIPLEQKYALHAALCRGLPDLYVTKNTDYDDSFGKSIDEDGYIAAVTRLGDKLNRTKKLLGTFTLEGDTQRVKDESIGDTLRDMANYSLMLLTEFMIREGLALPVEWLAPEEQPDREYDDSDSFADDEKG